MEGKPQPGLIQADLGDLKPAAKSARRKEVPTLTQVGVQRDWDLARLKSLLQLGRNRFDFLTAGTSGKHPETLLRYMGLPMFDSRLLVDIRANPASQHTPEWNKTRLAEISKQLGIDYRHAPELGVPRDLRNRLHHANLPLIELFTWYDTNVLSSERLSYLRSLVKERPLFLCTELGPTFCHRHRLALALEHDSGLVSFDL